MPDNNGVSPKRPRGVPICQKKLVRYLNAIWIRQVTIFAKAQRDVRADDIEFGLYFMFIPLLVSIVLILTVVVDVLLPLSNLGRLVLYLVVFAILFVIGYWLLRNKKAIANR